MHYHRLAVLSLLGTAPLADLATPRAPLRDDMLVKHRLHVLPENWESLGHPPAGTTIDLHIALEPHRENALIDALYQVSDPSHPKYGAHLSREQVAELVAPHPHTLELVYSWLEHRGVSTSISITHGGGWLTVTNVPVIQANDLLDASYQLYRHTGNNKTILRTVSYGLPAVLHGHVQTVAPTTYFSPPRTLQQMPRKHSREGEAAKGKAMSGDLVLNRDEDDEDDEGVTLEFLRSLYKTETYVPAATDRNFIGIAGYNGQPPNQEDLTLFMYLYRTEAQDATFTVVQVNGGGYDPSGPGKEGRMNIQYAEGMAYPTPHIFYSLGGDREWSLHTYQPTAGDSDLAWINYLLSQPNIPQTISISYGNEEEQLPQEYAAAVCILFAHLGVRGISVLFATANDGVGQGDCKAGTEEVQFVSFFPASCPWVTSVGGTTSHHPEVAASLSSGGFSEYFPRPRYQDVAVPSFLDQLGTEYEDYYNPDGRGFPDIAGQALEFNVVVGGRIFLISGTSCATPTVAGVISLLNDYLLASGRAPLGFLNPWLYGLGRAGLNDITSGSNPGCNTDGFPAVVGWDPVTGLGTPDFKELQSRLPQILADGTAASSIAVTSHSESSTPSSTPTCSTPISC